jgi:phenylalanyl-tRNA synthetase beta chain
MKISFRWLGRHVDLSGLTPAEVANDLTIHTAEVEGCERFAPWLSEVVVGHVVERAKHPDADKLSLCRVDVGPRGEGQLLQIVCGANNVAAGQRSPWRARRCRATSGSRGRRSAGSRARA